MVATHACKGKVRYRYYVSRDLHHSGDARSAEGWRLPAREIEPLVRAKSSRFSTIRLNCSREPPMRCRRRMSSTRSLSEARRPHPRLPVLEHKPPSSFGALLLKSDLVGSRSASRSIRLRLEALLDIRITNEAIRLDIAGRLKRSGHVMRLIQRNGSAAAPNVDRTLVKAIVQGRSWWRELQANTAMTVEDLAQREGMTAAYIVRIVRLAFLSPTMLKSIIDGTLPAHLTVKRLCAPDAVPARWDRQFA